MNYFLEETEDSNPHLTTIRTVSSSCRRASITPVSSLIFIMNEQFSLHLDFQNFSMFTRLQRFEQCLHRQFFVPV